MCLCCRVSWRFARYHVTHYNDSRGCLPLCEHCWSRLPVASRLPYYSELMDRWERDGTGVYVPRAGVLAAVRAGL